MAPHSTANLQTTGKSGAGGGGGGVWAARAGPSVQLGHNIDTTTSSPRTTTTSITPAQHSTAQHRTCSIPAGCLHSKKVFAPLCKPVVLGNGHVSKMLVRMKQEQMYTTDAIDCLITWLFCHDSLNILTDWLPWQLHSLAWHLDRHDSLPALTAQLPWQLNCLDSLNALTA